MQAHILAADKVLDYVRPAIGGIEFRFTGCPDVGVDSGKPFIGAYPVEGNFLHPDSRRPVAEVDDRPGGAHRAEGSCGYHIHFLGQLGEAFLLRHSTEGLGSDHHRLSCLDLLVDLGNRFCHKRSSIR